MPQNWGTSETSHKNFWKNFDFSKIFRKNFRKFFEKRIRLDRDFLGQKAKLLARILRSKIPEIARILRKFGKNLRFLPENSENPALFKISQNAKFSDFSEKNPVASEKSGKI